MTGMGFVHSLGVKCHNFEECLQYTARGVGSCANQHGENIHGLLIINSFSVLQLPFFSKFDFTCRNLLS